MARSNADPHFVSKFSDSEMTISTNHGIKYFPSQQQHFTHRHTHAHAHMQARTRFSSSSFIVTLSLIRRTACACAEFSGCSSTTNAHSEAGKMAVCCRNLPLGALSSRSDVCVLIGGIFEKFCPFLNKPRKFMLNYL